MADYPAPQQDHSKGSQSKADKKQRPLAFPFWSEISYRFCVFQCKYRAWKERRKEARDALGVKWTDRVIAHFTWVMGLATFIIAVETALTTWVIWHSADDSAKIVAADDRMATALEKSLSQAQKTLEATIAAARLDQRAWIGVEGIGGAIAANKPYTIAVGFRNSGKTPAKNVSLQMQFNPIRKGQILKYTYDHPVSGRGFVPPNGTFTSEPISPTHETPLKESEIALIKSGELRAYIYGIVTYEDIFDRPHWMKFCYFIATDAQSYSACKDYNNADEEKPINP